ncbi:restriction endonuclease subunit S [Agrobacterium sp. CR_3]|uniref:restriction endonuclease subunit S n=1 Tax=Agrobacterium sp. CR_3 TaxID=3055791 RepID=UPI0035BED53F
MNVDHEDNLREELGPIPEGWVAVRFASVREWLQYGTSLRCRSEPTEFPVLRIPNIELGQVNTSDLKFGELSTSEASRYRLEEGDLIFIRTNGVVERLGSCAVYENQPENALFASYLIRARLKLGRVDPHFAAYFFASERGNRIIAGRATPAADGKFNLNTGTIDSLPFPLPPTLDEQREIVRALASVRDAIKLHDQSLAVSRSLKSAAMRALFTKGMRGEAQKDTEIGPVPESWEVRPLEAIANIYSSSRLGYGELLAREELPSAPSSLYVLGIKVIDMTRCEAEAVLDDAELKKFVPKAEAEQRCIAPGAIVFPKNGAAVATNKKRRVGSWCVLDPNVMALHAKEEVDQAFLFQWMLNFDLRSLVKPGPVPNFGKGDISGISVQFPPTLDEQREIVAVLNAIDRKIDLQKRKRAVLDELFKALLHKLMTGEVRVADLDLSAIASMKEEAAA